MKHNPFDDGYYRSDELRCFGLKSVGDDVAIAKGCTIVGLENICIGDRVRIDGYCSLLAVDGEIVIGSNVHIGAYCYLAGGARIELKDFSGLSQGVKIYTKSDNYDGSTLTNPTIPTHYTHPQEGRVVIGRHSIIGSGAVVLPGVIVGDGVAVGAMALVSKSLDEWSVYAGVPAKKIKSRQKEILEAEKRYLDEIDSH